MTYEIGAGYQKQTGWIGLEDGFLVLDRNFDQNVDNGTERLSNSLVADPAKGLRSLADWCITAIYCSSSCYDFGGESGMRGGGHGSISTHALEAKGEGTRYTPVGVGIKIDSTNGAPQIVMEQIQSEAAHRTLQSANETWRQAA